MHWLMSGSFLKKKYNMDLAVIFNSMYVCIFHYLTNTYIKNSMCQVLDLYKY